MNPDKKTMGVFKMLRSKIARLGSALVVAGLSMAAYADGPNPNEVYVNNIVHAGTGCPIGSVASDISEDAKAFTLLFDNYLVEAGPGIPRGESRKFCQLTVNLHVPQGWSYTLFDVTYAGFANLDSGTSGTEKSTYYFEGNPSGGVTLASTIRGQFNSDYHIQDRLGIDALVWSPCGINRALNIKSAIQVDARPGQRALMTIDSIDGELRHIYGIAWRRCQ
jgi:hypothetical protein